MGQIYRIRMDDNAKLLAYEEKVLLRYSRDFSLPFSIVRDEYGEYIDYLTDGFIPIEKFEFDRLGNVFNALQTLVESYIYAQKHLLNPFRFFSNAGNVFISCKDGRAVSIFGRSRNDCDSNRKEEDLLLPIISFLSMQREVVCAKDAMEGINNKIRGNNLGLKDILRVVQDTGREWSLILPAAFDR